MPTKRHKHASHHHYDDNTHGRRRDKSGKSRSRHSSRRRDSSRRSRRNHHRYKSRSPSYSRSRSRSRSHSPSYSRPRSNSSKNQDLKDIEIYLQKLRSDKLSKVLLKQGLVCKEELLELSSEEITKICTDNDIPLFVQKRLENEIFALRSNIKNKDSYFTKRYHSFSNSGTSNSGTISHCNDINNNSNNNNSNNQIDIKKNINNSNNKIDIKYNTNGKFDLFRELFQLLRPNQSYVYYQFQVYHIYEQLVEYYSYSSEPMKQLVGALSGNKNDLSKFIREQHQARILGYPLIKCIYTDLYNMNKKDFHNCVQRFERLCGNDSAEWPGILLVRSPREWINCDVHDIVAIACAKKMTDKEIQVIISMFDECRSNTLIGINYGGYLLQQINRKNKNTLVSFDELSNVKYLLAEMERLINIVTNVN